jgi:hypothetical protein
VILFCWHAKGKFVFADSQRNLPILIQDASRGCRLGLDSVSPTLPLEPFLRTQWIFALAHR